MQRHTREVLPVEALTEADRAAIAKAEVPTNTGTWTGNLTRNRNAFSRSACRPGHSLRLSVACRASAGPGGGRQGPAWRHHAGRRGRRRRDGGHRPSVTHTRLSIVQRPWKSLWRPNSAWGWTVNAPGSSAARSIVSYGLGPDIRPIPGRPGNIAYGVLPPGLFGRSRRGCSRLPTPAPPGHRAFLNLSRMAFLVRMHSSSATLCRRARDLRHVGRRRRGVRLREGVYVLHGDPR